MASRFVKSMRGHTWAIGMSRSETKTRDRSNRGTHLTCLGKNQRGVGVYVHPGVQSGSKGCGFHLAEMRKLDRFLVERPLSTTRVYIIR